MSPLIDPEGLKAALAQPQPPIVLDCRARLDDRNAGLALWQAGHIPGSHHLDMDRDLAATPGEGGRHPLPSPHAFTATLRRLDISPERGVVVYDDRGGQLAAARAWWMIGCWAGHPDVRVLDGGLPAWQALAGPLTSSVPATPAGSDWEPRFDNSQWLTAADLLASASLRVDARGEARFGGEEEPIDPVAGHIPGAVCRPTGANLQADGRFKPAVELAQALPQANEVTAYCGSGVSACHEILAYAVAGLPRPRLYVGSWSDWIRDPARPVATGQ
ncbi:sulfurtransferase [Salinicola rhizosphaerae]|uniref:Sulfurtransferase n=1 Tax=Salinicola rhizosphaerae TaxID=1443141 RepID=A0ABQ3DNR4_9GAMM|nr:sulfurtransferase [Salinicola rhizosphaerae]GHB08193.1 sulfurtransferase [Salinicola rhizosphaerae]